MGIYVRVDVPIPEDLLCFTAEEDNATMSLTASGSPTAVNLEISTDGLNWSDYTIGDTITLTSTGDKVYMRNKSETPTGFSTGTSNVYNFNIYSAIGVSGDIGYLLCKNSTDTIQGNYCFYRLFESESKLTKAPSLPATTLTRHCYDSMFRQCSNLTTIPALPATTMMLACYESMFWGCSSIKLSDTQTGDYTQEYRIPTTGTGTTASSWNNSMWSQTGGTYTSAPEIDTTYYLHKDNTIV